MMRGRSGEPVPHYAGPAWLETPPPAPATGPPGPRLVADNRGLLGRGLGKNFKRRPVLRGVTVAVQRGEVVGLLGPNGAGKTTCFYIITGLIAADTGTVELDGRDITELPMYRRARLGIGYLPQEASIFRGLTVEQNIRADRDGLGEVTLAQVEATRARPITQREILQIALAALVADRAVQRMID